VKDEAEAIAVANISVFGLGGGIFTRDLASGSRRRRSSGLGLRQCDGRLRSELPFGGVKESGYGRELSQYGIKEFVNIKTVVVADGSAKGPQQNIE